MGDVEVLVQISPRKQTVVRIAEELVLSGGWRQAAKERAAVLEGWTIFDIQRARIGLRPEDKQRLALLCRERVVELVHTKDGVVPVEELTAEQKRSLDRWIVKTWVNTLYQGRAEVYYPEAEKTGCHTSLRAGSQ